MTERQQAYAEYLESDHWHRLRSKAIERDKCCVRCGGKKRLQAHHKIYRVSWFDTLLSDLETLCRLCHESEHGMNDQTETGQFIPSHAFIAVDALKELEKLRRNGKISRKEFKEKKKAIGACKST